MHKFRGFVKTLIPLSKVNFFVGENSTGKTSVLSAIEILSSAEFFYSAELSSQFCDFSAFEDSTSEVKTNAKFSLGYFRLSFSKEKFGTTDAAAFHF